LIGVAQSPRANILFSDVLSSTNTCKWSLVKILPERFSLQNGDAAVSSFGERPKIEYDQALTRVSSCYRNQRLSALDTIFASLHRRCKMRQTGFRCKCETIEGKRQPTHDTRRSIALAYLPSSFYECLANAYAGRQDICQRTPW
jgi:hypothetical protein